MRVVCSKEMKEIESHAIDKLGFNESLIIENVGLNGADIIHALYLEENDFDEIIIMVGRGNNGADGLAIGRHLSNRGFPVRAFMLFAKEECTEELKNQANLARAFGVRISEVSSTDDLESYFSQVSGNRFVIDAILGMGFRQPLSNYLFDIVNMMNSLGAPVVSIDIPTGVCSDTGAVGGSAIEADMTLTIALPKTGLFSGEGSRYIGAIEVVDGGFPRESLEGGDKALLSTHSAMSFYSARSKWAHKNNFGHTLVVGGSLGMTGAVQMTSAASLKVGTGLVTASTWKDSYQELVSRIMPEVMTGLIPTEQHDIEDIIKNLERWDSIVIGPGLGRSGQTRKVVLDLLNHFAGPVVVDADAIHVLSFKEDFKILADRKWPTVLTPHMGEFAHFIGVETKKVVEEPMKYLKEVVDQCHCSFVMKGPSTFVGFPDDTTYINYFPNDGMATGGSGDVLAGIIGGLLAQYPMEVKSSAMFADKSIVYDAIRLGVVAHSLAGKHAAEKYGTRAMTAGDIIEHLSDAFLELEKGEGELS